MYTNLRFIITLLTVMMSFRIEISISIWSFYYDILKIKSKLKLTGAVVVKRRQDDFICKLSLFRRLFAQNALVNTSCFTSASVCGRSFYFAHDLELFMVCKTDISFSR